jgi:cytochrome b
MIMLIRVWDAPTRLFHWALALCFVGLIVTSQIGGAAMNWHFRFGYGVSTLLLFRVAWGLFGGHWSRFSTFVVGPTRVWRYLRGQGQQHDNIGHNPLGGLSILAMMTFLVMQVASGLMSDDEIMATGPLVRFVSPDWVSYASFYHTEIGKIILLGLVVLHISAITFYYFSKRENLVKPMITGDKSITFDAPSARDAWPERRRAALIFLVCASVVGSLVTLLNG